MYKNWNGTKFSLSNAMSFNALSLDHLKSCLLPPLEPTPVCNQLSSYLLIQKT